MAKKPKLRRTTSAAARHAIASPPQRPWWQHKVVWGSVVLLLVIGIGVWIRYSLFRPVLLPGAVGQHYTRGPAGAPVVLKEFSDYTWPHCRALQEPLARALQRFAGQVQLVLYPIALNNNPKSLVASQAALCAGEQGKFWDMHHLLYDQQPQWVQATDPLQRISALAKGLGLEEDTLTRCVNSQRMRPILDANQTQARSLQVRSTPTVFVNAQRLIGADGDLVGTIQRELDRVKRSSP